MAKIKLFSGMDFSGKTTIIKNIDMLMPNFFKVQSKFLTSIDTIQKVRKRESWLPPEEWKPLIKNTIKKDISDYRENGLILQDSLWIIKYLATTIERGNPEDYEEIKQLTKLLKKYPEMNSFYITTTIEERIKRFRMRKSSKMELTNSDKILLDIKRFNRIEEIYRKIVLNRFPKTIIIDTTYSTVKETVKNIVQSKYFRMDL